MAKKSLELSIYQFVLKEKDVRKGEYYDLGAFYRLHFRKSSDKGKDVDQKELYTRFMQAIVEDFNSEFKLNNEGSKGFSTDILKSYSNDNLIDGTINGGDRGQNHKIFKIKNSLSSISQLNEDELVALPHYFKIWTPPKSQVGVIMIQNYSNAGINTLILNFLKDFFSKYNTTFHEYRHVPEKIRENFIKKSIVKKVVFAKTKLSEDTRKAFNYAFSDSKGLKIKLEITGFNEDKNVLDFLSNFKKSSKLIGVDLSSLDIQGDQDVKTTLYYQDDKGRKAHAKIESNLQINPTILLPDELMTGNEIDYDLIKGYTDELLKVVQKEINYKP